MSKKTIIFEFGELSRRWRHDSATVKTFLSDLALAGYTCRFGLMYKAGTSAPPTDFQQWLEEVGLSDTAGANIIALPVSEEFWPPDDTAFRIATAILATPKEDLLFISGDFKSLLAATGAGVQSVMFHSAKGAPSEDRTLSAKVTSGYDASVGLLAEVDADTGPTYLLRGRVVTMNDKHDVIDNGAVLVSNGVIVDILEPSQPRPENFSDVTEIETGGTIYPGLIDLHNHFVYNVLPIWVVPRRYENRSQWPRHTEYRSGVSQPIRNALAKYTVSAEAVVRYVECKALLGGTTTGQGMRTRVRGGARMFRGAMRNVEVTGDERLPEARTRVPDLSVTGSSGPENIDSFRRALIAMQENGGAYFYHLSEGTDQRARRHFLNLHEHDLVAQSLVGIHSLGLHRSDLELMAEKGAKIVWSPFSNMLLYGATLSLGDVKATGVELCLGCDWSPSGSKNLLQELKVAQFVNKSQGEPFSNRQIVEMVTSSAAHITGWRDYLGAIKKGAFADLLVVGVQAGDAYDALIESREDNISLVTVHGIARLGDSEIVRKIHADSFNKLEKINVNGVEKLLYLHSPESPINHVTMGQATEILRDAMADLPGFVDQQETLEADLMASGIVLPQQFALELDNEFELFGDPFAEYDDGSGEIDLLADVPMVDSLELELPFVSPGESSYWGRVSQQGNVPEELIAKLLDDYHVP